MSSKRGRCDLQEFDAPGVLTYTARKKSPRGAVMPLKTKSDHRENVHAPIDGRGCSRRACTHQRSGRRANRTSAAVSGRAVLAETAARQLDPRPGRRHRRRQRRQRLDHPPALDPGRRREGRAEEPARNPLLQRRAAGAAVLCRRQAAQKLGRARRRLRLAEYRARHPCRQGRQRLARRQRQGRPPDLEVHARRQVPAADRQDGRDRRLQQQDRARPPRTHGDGRGRRRAVRGGRLSQPPHRRVRPQDRRLQAALGRLRHQGAQR